jgi:hypothetical protein
MASAQGISKLLVYKKELVAWGTKAVAAGGSYLRRVTGTFQLEKDSYSSNEILPSQQVRDFRHGTRRSSGAISGELSGSGYEDFIQAILRRDFTAGATTGAVITISATATTNLFTRSAGSFITDGFGVGSIISNSGFVAPGNNGLFVVTAITATVLTVLPLAGQTIVTVAAGASVTILEKGKKTYVPLTSHTDDSFTFEEYYPDIPLSRTFLGQQVDTMAIAMQPNAMATIDFGFLGKDAEAATGTAYFTTPTAVGSEALYTGSDGFLLINGVSNGVVTSLSLSVASNIQQEAVIGSNSIGAKARGKVMVTLDGSAIFDSTTILNYFSAETEVSMQYIFMSADDTQAFSIYMPRVKIGTGTVDDGEKVIILSFSGQALEYTAGATGVELTTIKIQDTSLV